MGKTGREPLARVDRIDGKGINIQGVMMCVGGWLNPDATASLKSLVEAINTAANAWASDMEKRERERILSSVMVSIRREEDGEPDARMDAVREAVVKLWEKGDEDVIKKAVNAKLEEAAKLVNGHYWDSCGSVGEAHGNSIAEMIRKLKKV
jgi:hypothetical protein